MTFDSTTPDQRDAGTSGVRHALDDQHDPATIPDPLPLPGAGGPVGGPLAGEVLDVLNQPLTVDSMREQEEQTDDAP